MSDEPTTQLYLITAPVAGDVVSLEDMKKHLRVDHTDDDDLITAITAAAVQHLDGADGWLGRALTDQTWELRLSAWPCDGIVKIPLPPLIDVVSLKYRDEDEAEQTYDDANYHVLGAGSRKGGRIQLANDQTWPTVASGWPEPVIVQFRAGYIDGGSSPYEPNVPAPIIAAIKLFAGTLYEHRETIVIGQTAVELPWAAEQLLRPYRVFSH